MQDTAATGVPTVVKHFQSDLPGFLVYFHEEMLVGIGFDSRGNQQLFSFLPICSCLLPVTTAETKAVFQMFPSGNTTVRCGRTLQPGSGCANLAERVSHTVTVSVRRSGPVRAP
jgi:hypothetical protein